MAKVPHYCIIFIPSLLTLKIIADSRSSSPVHSPINHFPSLANSHPPILNWAISLFPHHLSSCLILSQFFFALSSLADVGTGLIEAFRGIGKTGQIS